MLEECHAHIFMDGKDYRKARDLYAAGICDRDIREKLSAYRAAGVDYVRDGGDTYGACSRARELAEAYDIEYRIPVFAIHKTGCYGGIVGRGFETMTEYTALVREVKAAGGDFIKIMLSGIMNFAGDGGVTGVPLDRQQIREMIHIAHEEGFAVMAHVNGTKPILAAIEAGVDSIEHGNFMDEETLCALAQSRTVWVPTNVTIHNLIGKGRFDDALLKRLDEQSAAAIQSAYRKGAFIAAGSDAGAYGVLHGEGILQERQRLEEILSRVDGDPAGASGELKAAASAESTEKPWIRELRLAGEEIRKRFRPGE